MPDPQPSTEKNDSRNEHGGSHHQRPKPAAATEFPYNSNDYYALLGVPKTASMADIKKAYKRQAFVHHPDKSRDPDSAFRFAKISTAFDVLSNPTKRSLYDAYGVEGVRRSNTMYEGNHPGHYQNGFTTDDYFSSFQHDENGAHVVYKDPPVHHDLYVTLEEVLDGSKRKVKITRKLFTDDLTSSKLEEKILVIQIKPGWKAGTKIIFEREGDRKPGILPADIIFVIKDKPHQVFKRSGSDIVYTARITLRAALLGGQLMIPLLGKEKKLLKWTDVISPRSEKRLRGVGLPTSSAAGASRGDLVVRFDISFPKQISEQEKNLIARAIPPHHSLIVNNI